MLTSEQEAIIESTAPVVAEHLEEITQRFYPLMFDRYPDVKALFNSANQESGAQARALAQSILTYVGMRRDPRRARAELATAINKHVSLGIQPDHYPIVGECLMAAIAEVLGDAVTQDVADAWSALYEELAGLMIEAEACHYHEFANRKGGWQGQRRFRVSHRQPESRVITSFEFVPVDGGAVADFQPGQHIGLRLEINGEPVYRHYSLSAAPNGESYRISVKREPEGHVSQFLHDELKVGDEVDLLPPAGDLVLQGNEPLLLISGGVGQTPLLPMVQEALRDGQRVIYLHAARDAEHHAFRREVEALADAFPELLSPVFVYESGEALPGHHQGRIDETLLERCLPEEPVRCYFVGPEGFMNAVNGALKKLGVPESRRHYEHFGPSRPLEAA